MTAVTKHPRAPPEVADGVYRLTEHLCQDGLAYDPRLRGEA